MIKVQDRPVADTPSIYMIATVARPQIVCPSWCDVTEAEHIRGLQGAEGMTDHTSDSIHPVADACWSLSSSTTTDGAEDPTGEPGVRMYFGGNDSATLDEAEAAFKAGLALIAEARRAATVVRTPTVA